MVVAIQGKAAPETVAEDTHDFGVHVGSKCGISFNSCCTSSNSCAGGFDASAKMLVDGSELEEFGDFGEFRDFEFEDTFAKEVPPSCTTCCSSCNACFDSSASSGKGGEQVAAEDFDTLTEVSFEKTGLEPADIIPDDALTGLDALEEDQPSSPPSSSKHRPSVFGS